MAVDVIMPQMGESIFEGTITKWLKKPGDKIDRDEPLFEISTDKVDAEIPSPSAGVLKEIKVTEGQTVPIQTIVAVIDADGTAAASSAASAQPRAKRPRRPLLQAPQARPEAVKPSAAAPAPPPQAAKAAPDLLLPPAETATPQPPSGVHGSKVRSSPLVRRIARENKVDLAQVPGTGAGGRVSKRDILAAVEGGEPAGASSARRTAALPGASASGRWHAASRCSRRPYPARRCTSATTKCSPCRSCGRGSPSTWCSPSAFRRTCIRSTKST